MGRIPSFRNSALAFHWLFIYWQLPIKKKQIPFLRLFYSLGPMGRINELLCLSFQYSKQFGTDIIFVLCFCIIYPGLSSGFLGTTAIIIILTELH